MRIQDLLETVDDDRRLIEASYQIYNALKRYKNTEIDKTVYVGQVKDIIDFPFPAICGIQIEIASQDSINNDNNNITHGTVVAYYNLNTYTITFSAEQLNIKDRFYFISTINHELRHALDFMLSKYTPSNSSRYFKPKKKEHRTGEETKYIAKPSEINARFSQVLHLLFKHIPPKDEIEDKIKLRNSLLNFTEKLFEIYQISELFPEKTASKDYKRLLNRAYKFINDSIQ